MSTPQGRTVGGSSCILVTGGLGFIGGALVELLLRAGQTVVNVDAHTYASNPLRAREFVEHPGHRLIKGDIADAALMADLFETHRPRAVLNLAAQTHVDRSIDEPSPFVRDNIVGCSVLLQVATKYFKRLKQPDEFRFLQMSTDEVYGDREASSSPADESAAYAPSSPYAASKAAADQLVMAWGRTYGLPTLIAHACNVYGPYQFSEKLIPLAIAKTFAGQVVPVYGDGEQQRQWIYVYDCARALIHILDYGRVGQRYNICGSDPISNRRLLESLAAVLREAPGALNPQLRHVQDRPGHDRLYHMNDGKLRDGLSWRPEATLPTGLKSTVAWYRSHEEWLFGAARETYDGRRLGLQT